MNKPPSWSAALVDQLIMRVVMAQTAAVYRVQQKGGHQVAQACAAITVRESLIDGATAATAIQLGIQTGMKINRETQPLSQIKARLPW